jgi:CheY-like chemotaxis protein
VTTKITGVEGLAAAVTGEFDVVLCDLTMPGLSGMEIYERARAARPGIEKSFVFMTGGTFDPKVADFVHTIENLTIEKPFTVEALNEVIARMPRRPPEPQTGR